MDEKSRSAHPISDVGPFGLDALQSSAPIYILTPAAQRE